MSNGKRPSMTLVRRIAAEEAPKVKIPVTLVFTKNRQHHVAWVRSQICKRLRDDGYSLGGIGACLNRDHTSVIHLLQREWADGPPRPRPISRAPKPPRERVLCPVFVPAASLVSDFIRPIPIERLMAGR